MKFTFTNDRPIYTQLVEHLQLEILSGRIPPGARLPSVRELALLSQVNPNTMQRALSELEDLKLIYTKRTNGKFVTDNTKHIQKLRHKIASTKIDNFLEDMEKTGFAPDDIINYLIEKGILKS